MDSMSCISSCFHCVFSTKERRPLITPALRERLWPFLGGIARQNEIRAVEIGGVEEHIHILLCGNEFQPSLRDLFLRVSNPALKRRAIFRLSRWDEAKAGCSERAGISAGGGDLIQGPTSPRDPISRSLKVANR